MEGGGGMQSAFHLCPRKRVLTPEARKIHHLVARVHVLLGPRHLQVGRGRGGGGGEGRGGKEKGSEHESVRQGHTQQRPVGLGSGGALSPLAFALCAKMRTAETLSSLSTSTRPWLGEGEDGGRGRDKAVRGGEGRGWRQAREEGRWGEAGERGAMGWRGTTHMSALSLFATSLSTGTMPFTVLHALATPPLASAHFLRPMLMMAIDVGRVPSSSGGAF